VKEEIEKHIDEFNEPLDTVIFEDIIWPHILFDLKKDDTNWKELEWFIDDIRLSEHLCNKKIIEFSEKMGSFGDLCPARTND